MKKLFLFLLLVATVFSAGAKEVPEQRAKDIAVQFISSRTARQASVKSIQAVGQDKKAYYVVNFAPQGWALIAADDVVRPIIGYSKTGSLSLSLIPDNMKFVLDEYEKEIATVARTVTSEHPYWSMPTGTLTRASGTVIEPLIQVNWNQSAPYNVYCPQKKALVGCVAVAMSQAMSVQRYPARAKGSVSYTSPNYGGMSINYDNEMAYNWDDILSGANNYDEAARLMFHAGMSVKMDYGEDGSGIPSNEVNRISDALKNNFSYPESVEYIWREHYSGDWEQLLLNELNAGRAIIYNAVDSQARAGHSFNLDGYDGDGHFHVNWGWGGYGNGEFAVDGLRDLAMSMNYDTYHVVVIGIGAPDQVLKSISLSTSRIEEGLPAGAVVGSVLVNKEAPKAGYRLTVHGTYDSRTGSYATVPFVVEDGMLKTTETLNATTTSQWNVEITVEDPESGSSLTQGFRIVVDPWKSLESTTSLKYDRRTGSFTLATKHNVSYRMLDANGQVLQEGRLEPLPELQFSATQLSPGRNSIELTCGDETKTFQIITKE